MVLLGWLCFTLAALPCAAATADVCCPGQGAGHHSSSHDAEGASAHAAHGHGPGGPGHADGGHGDGTHAGPTPTCGAQSDDGCCDPAVPTMEDRNPPVPAKVADLADFDTRMAALPDRPGSLALLRRSTGPPGMLCDGAPRRHALFCTYLD